jgi:protocatechuate 3,4-dioxygenase beta subunit
MKRYVFLTVFAVLAGSFAAGSELRGVVYSAAASPAKDAIVWAAPMEIAPRKTIETHTNADGRFVLDLAEGRWFVHARLGSHGGEADNEHGLITIKSDNPAPVAIRLADRGFFRGRLLEAETGKPIPKGNLQLDNGVLITTDEAGRFEIGGMKRRHHEAFAICPGRVRERILFDTSLRSETQLDIRLPRAGKIRGIVLDEKGSAIPYAQVWRATSGSTLSLAGLVESCDEKGRFEWDGAAFDAAARLEASAPGYAEEEYTGIRVSEGEEPPNLVFRLQREDGAEKKKEKPSDKTGKLVKESAKKSVDETQRTISGRVLSPEGKPVSDALVRWGATMYEETKRETRSDKNGEFALEKVPAREGFLTVIAKSYAPAFPSVKGTADKRITVELEDGATAVGTVGDDLGNPLEGVSVIPVIASPDRALCNPLWLSELKVTTDKAGKFELTGLPREGARFDFLRSDLSDLRNQSLTLGGERNSIIMQATGAIRGRVVDEQGKPVQNFRILIQIPRSYDRAKGEKVGGYFAGYEWPGISFTSEDGEFVASGLTVGHLHRVTALAEGHGQVAMDRVKAHPVTHLPPAEELTLRLTSPYRLRVCVVDEVSSKPIGKAMVTLVDGDRELDSGCFNWGYNDSAWVQTVRARTDEAGWAAFTGLPFGEATVLVESNGYARQRSGWRAKEGEMTIALKPQSVVSGVVTGKKGPRAKLYGVTLACSSRDTFNDTIHWHDEGRFKFEQLPPGKYTLRVLEGFKEVYSKQFVLGHAQKFEVEASIGQ